MFQIIVQIVLVDDIEPEVARPSVRRRYYCSRKMLLALKQTKNCCKAASYAACVCLCHIGWRGRRMRSLSPHGKIIFNVTSVVVSNLDSQDIPEIKIRKWGNHSVICWIAEEAKEEKGTLGKTSAESWGWWNALLRSPWGPHRDQPLIDAHTVTYAHTAESNKPDSKAKKEAP